ncbi:MAG: hypothetical protein ACYC1S_06005 [Gemmatimonadaceae bacterium]
MRGSQAGSQGAPQSGRTDRGNRNDAEIGSSADHLDESGRDRDI